MLLKDFDYKLKLLPTHYEDYGCLLEISKLPNETILGLYTNYYSTYSNYEIRTVELKDIEGNKINRNIKEIFDNYISEGYYYIQKNKKDIRFCFRLPVLDKWQRNPKIKPKHNFMAFTLNEKGYKLRISTHVLDGKNIRLKPLSDSEYFNNLELSEKRNLLELILSNSEENLQIAMGILNLL